MSCRAEEEQTRTVNKESPTASSSDAVDQGTTSSTASSSSFGRRVAVGSVGLGAAAFAVSRLSKGEVTLKTLEQNSLPLDTALRNKKPTIVEFYANWCEVCRELTPEVYKVEQEFKDRINFVMLNIENPKWAPEMAEYRVSGIPHFVFLNGSGRAEAAAVGRLPLQVLERNVKALTDGAQLPFRRAAGETSSVSSSSLRREVNPRSHS